MMGNVAAFVTISFPLIFVMHYGIHQADYIVIIYIQSGFRHRYNMAYPLCSALYSEQGPIWDTAVMLQDNAQHRLPHFCSILFPGGGAEVPRASTHARGPSGGGSGHERQQQFAQRL